MAIKHLQSHQKGHLYNMFLSCCSIIALVMLPVFVKAQLPTTAAAYPFVASSKTFTYLSGSTPVIWTFGNVDDDYCPNIPIGFPFTYCGVTYTTVTAMTNGYMSFGNKTGYTYPSNAAYITTTGPCVMCGWADQMGRPGPATYQTIGTAPNRIFVLEFKDWGNWSGGTTPYVSYQYRLYEGGAVELMFDQVGSGGGFPSQAAMGIANTTTDYQTLSNLSATPTSSSATFNNSTIAGTRPAAGQSYLWGLIPCKGTPQFDIVGPYQVCPGKSFTLTLGGTGIISDLTFQWQYSTDGGITWLNILGATTNSITETISVPTWYRANITCTNSGLSYTTPAWKVSLAEFMFCYCDNGAAVATGLDIGNFTIAEINPGAFKTDTILNNGISTPPAPNSSANKTYTSFQYSLPPVVMYRDSTYSFSVARISSAALTAIKDANVTVFIDVNRNGVFDGSEMVFKKQINSLSLIAHTEVDTFTIPSSAEIGLTGMRVVMRDGPTDSCGFVGEGETEDYIVDMRYEPCSGPISAGTVEALDTTLCPGYDYIVTDSTFEKKKSEISRFWQVSADNVSWTNISGSNGKDSLMRIFTGQPLYYRVRAICDATADTTYTDAMLINAKPGYKCYCYSQAIGGFPADSSDIGGVTIGNYTMITGGPHLQNASATRKRTDHTDGKVIELDIDSTYSMIVYHTLRSKEHGDAKITIFMDFNNDKEYDIPNERVFTGYTSVGNFTIADNVTIPATVITGLETGLRVVLNNNLGPNVPSDEACGAYMSGETEDFMVKFSKRLFPAGVTATSNISSFALIPNPSNGKFMVQFGSPKAVSNVEVIVTTVTGQQVYQETFTHAGGQFSKAIDISNMSRGVYMVTLNADGEKLIRKMIID